MNFKSILVTGCCGDIAASISEIVRQSAIVQCLIGCDIHAPTLGCGLFDACEVVPRADDPEYLPRLTAAAAKHDVDAVIPLSDMELRTFLKARCLDRLDRWPVVAANAVAVRIGLDKLETNRILVEKGLPAPWTRIVGRDEPIELPCVLKPRFGQGSKGVRRVDSTNFREFEKLGEDYIWQELILPDHQEYTSGVFAAADGGLRTITFRRQLSGGLTVVAEVARVAAIDALLVSIARALKLRGSINVQLRLSAEGPKVFEINPRFSSTVEFRHRLGFSDFVWSLLDRQGIPIGPYTPPEVGTTLVRSPQFERER